MEAFSIKFLLALSSFLGVSELPTTSPDWTIRSSWTQYSNGYVAQFDSKIIPQKCRDNPDAFIDFPQVVHSAHRILLDGRVIHHSGDFSFQRNRSFYGKPVLRCSQVQAGTNLSWEVASYSKYFSRFNYYPKISQTLPMSNLFFESFMATAGGSLIVLALFCLMIFYRRVSHNLLFSLVGTSIFWSIYFISSVSGFFGFHGSMLEMHRWADIGVHVGTVLFANALRLEKLIGNKLFLVYAANTAIAFVILVFGTSGDQLQFGTTLPFGMAITFFVVAITSLIRKINVNFKDTGPMLQLLSLGLFVLTIINDISGVTGLVNGVVLLTFGVVSGLFFFAVSVNEKIDKTYQERDYLRKNLEKEVELKTNKLSDAMKDLKTTQAELIQSAKLASLGTLSAGIAHEINNSLNFVNGALKPLEKEINKEDPNKGKISKLVDTMKEGLKLTFGIIASLRNYTGLNQAKLNDVEIKTVVDSVLAILKTRTAKTIDVNLEIQEGLKVFGSVVGLNQVLMNLINNSVDAMNGEGTLTIRATEVNEQAKIEIIDTGEGMDQETQQRIFEPFFTTKDVGKGTGLGMHIVKMEIEKHDGEISVQSEKGVGTTFTIVLPIEASEITATNLKEAA